MEEKEEELRLAIQTKPCYKAAPRHLVPSAAWKLCANAVAPLLTTAQSGEVPQGWTDAWLVWMPKPDKEASVPAGLRPLGLTDTIAKASVHGGPEHYGCFAWGAWFSTPN